jgi:hypothetical protein
MSSGGCIECGGPLGRQPRLAIFTMHGQNVSAPHCSQCWEDAKTRGGPGPNAHAHVHNYGSAAALKKDNRPLAQLG